MNYAILDGYGKVQDFFITSNYQGKSNFRKENYISLKEVELYWQASSNYMMRLVNKELNYDGILVELYNENGAKVATNFVNNHYYHGWAYKSKEAGKYKIKFIIDEKAKPSQATLSKKLHLKTNKEAK